MKRFQRIARAVLFPPIRVRWIFGAATLAAVLGVFLLRLSESPVAYPVFLASALGLYYLVTLAVPLVRSIKPRLMQFGLIRRYYEDWTFNARVGLYRGMALNVLYAAFKLLTGLYFRSEWLIAIAVYYGVLILLKATLVRQDWRHLRRGEAPDGLTEWKSYRRVGWEMLLMNVGLSGITAQVVAQNRSYSYPGFIIFAMAAYSFYRIILAVVRLFRGRAERTPIFSAARVIDVSFAVTAMFTLQTAMFASFSPELDVRVPNIITGTAVAVIITGMAAGMIVKATAQIRRLDRESQV